MTNTEELRKLIKDKGLKLKFLAETMGISSYSLSMKIDNVREFKTSEVQTLCDILGITSLKMKEQLFFSNKDD